MAVAPYVLVAGEGRGCGRGSRGSQMEVWPPATKLALRVAEAVCSRTLHRRRRVAAQQPVRSARRARMRRSSRWSARQCSCWCTWQSPRRAIASDERCISRRARFSPRGAALARARMRASHTSALCLQAASALYEDDDDGDDDEVIAVKRTDERHRWLCVRAVQSAWHQCLWCLSCALRISSYDAVGTFHGRREL